MKNHTCENLQGLLPQLQSDSAQNPAGDSPAMPSGSVPVGLLTSKPLQIFRIRHCMCSHLTTVSYGQISCNYSWDWVSSTVQHRHNFFHCPRHGLLQSYCSVVNADSAIIQTVASLEIQYRGSRNGGTGMGVSQRGSRAKPRWESEAEARAQKLKPACENIGDKQAIINFFSISRTSKAF